MTRSVENSPPISLVRFTASIAFFAILALAYPAVASPKAVPKKGRVHTPPLSTRIPEALSALPRFGKIAWDTHQLPWVGEGPYDGISGVGMVVIDNNIYIIGGFIPGGDETKDATSRRTSRWTWRFETATQTWSRMADTPIRREYVRATVSGGKIYLAGGGCQYKGQEPPYRVHGECAVFDPNDGEQGSWRMLESLKVPRTHMAVGDVNGKVLVVGGNEYAFSEVGYSHKTIRGTTEVFDTAAPAKGWQLKTSIPGAARGWCASLVAQGNLYLFGGITWREDNAIVGTRETLAYMPKKDQWKKLAPPPLPISGWEGALYKNRYAINVGGVVRPAPDSDEELVWSDLALVYDLEDDAWMRLDGALPPGAVFNDPGVVIIGNTIYVVGAEGPYGSHYDYFLVGQITPDSTE